MTPTTPTPNPHENLARLRKAQRLADALDALLRRDPPMRVRHEVEYDPDDGFAVVEAVCGTCDWHSGSARLGSRDEHEVERAGDDHWCPADVLLALLDEMLDEQAWTNLAIVARVPPPSKATRGLVLDLMGARFDAHDALADLVDPFEGLTS